MFKENNLTKIFLIVSARYQKVRMDCNVDFGQNLSCSLCTVSYTHLTRASKEVISPLTKPNLWISVINAFHAASIAS